MKGVVAGLENRVIAAAIGTLARTGNASSAALAICTPGIMSRMPTSRPRATPRGTERRVKRQSSGASTRCATGWMKRLFSRLSRLGIALRMALMKWRFGINRVP